MFQKIVERVLLSHRRVSYNPIFFVAPFCFISALSTIANTVKFNYTRRSKEKETGEPLYQKTLRRATTFVSQNWTCSNIPNFASIYFVDCNTGRKLNSPLAQQIFHTLRSVGKKKTKLGAQF